MASVDLKDYSVPVHENYQTYLTFFVEKYLKFVCMPHGYGPACEYLQKFQKYHFLLSDCK